jgi:hypothetical protein
MRLHKELQSPAVPGQHGKHETVRTAALYPAQGMIFYSEGSKVKVRRLHLGRGSGGG